MALIADITPFQLKLFLSLQILTKEKEEIRLMDPQIFEKLQAALRPLQLAATQKIQEKQEKMEKQAIPTKKISKPWKSIYEALQPLINRPFNTGVRTIVFDEIEGILKPYPWYSTTIIQDISDAVSATLNKKNSSELSLKIKEIILQAA
jgi:hypothetical protein